MDRFIGIASLIIGILSFILAIYSIYKTETIDEVIENTTKKYIFRENISHYIKAVDDILSFLDNMPEQSIVEQFISIVNSNYSTLSSLSSDTCPFSRLSQKGSENLTSFLNLYDCVWNTSHFRRLSNLEIGKISHKSRAFLAAVKNELKRLEK